MRRTTKILMSCVSAVALAIGAGGALAQSGPGPQGGRPGFPGGPGGPGFGPGGFGGRGGFGPGIEGCLNSGKVVSGEGYTGTLKYESVRPVLNGAPIDRSITETIARDNDGRTQREVTLPAFPNAPQGSAHQVICINDPVAGFGYVLDPAKMTARQFKLHQKPNAGSAGGTNSLPSSGGTNRPQGRGPNANVTSVSLNASSAPAGIQSECPGVTGTQKTRTLQIPSNGQTTAMQMVTTRWFCQAFSMNLYTQTNDPLQGITTNTITITGAGPGAIAVPSGYKITTAAAGPFGGPRRNGPPPATQQ
jgi:hypothetical protein